MPLVNDMPVILIVQLVGKVCTATGRTKDRHEPRVVAALLHVDNTKQVPRQAAAVCHVNYIHRSHRSVHFPVRKMSRLTDCLQRIGSRRAS